MMKVDTIVGNGDSAQSYRHQAAVAEAVHGARAVINLVGILTEQRPGDFQRIHADGAGRIAQAAEAAGVRQLVHVSAIGADPASPSLYARSKAAGEAAVRAAFPAATILRPSIVFGPEDDFFNRFGAMAQISPALPVIHGATRFQPVYVGDVADAILASLARPDAGGQTYELGGPKIWSFRDLLAYILQQTGRKRFLVTIPNCVAKVQAAVLERLPGKLLTQDQLVQLGRDNVVADSAAGLAALGVTPVPLELVVPAYLARFRPDGGAHSKH